MMEFLVSVFFIGVLIMVSMSLLGLVTGALFMDTIAKKFTGLRARIVLLILRTTLLLCSVGAFLYLDSALKKTSQSIALPGGPYAWSLGCVAVWLAGLWFSWRLMHERTNPKEV